MRRVSILQTSFAAIALAVACATAGCASSTPARSPGVATTAVAPAAAPSPPPPAKPRRPCGPTDHDYEAWFDRTFGTGPEVIQHGPDATRIQDLTGEPKAEAERMLRRGLAACSTAAVTAIERARWGDFVPDLSRAVAVDSPEFCANVILALKRLGSRLDFTEELIAVLSSRSTDARITAVAGARKFSIERFRGPLLDRVRQDPSWLVRVDAAESLYALADIYPRDLSDHPDVATAVHEGDERGIPYGHLDVLPPLTPELRARLAVAAAKLDAEITERLAGGPCSKPARLTMVDLYTISVREQSIMALAVEETLGSCERKLAFVVFVESAGGFSQVAAGVSGPDPLKADLGTLPKRVPVTYTRATGLLTVGTLTIDPAKSNVAVLSAGPKRVEVRYQGKQDLTFERRGPPWGGTGFPVVDYQPEIDEAVGALVDRTPELRALVTPAPDDAGSDDGISGSGSRAPDPAPRRPRKQRAPQ